MKDTMTSQKPSFAEVKLTDVPDVVEFKDSDGKLILSADLLSLNTCVTLSQEGLDKNNPSFTETSTFRLRDTIKEKFEVDLTLVQAYQVGVTCGQMFRELVASF